MIGARIGPELEHQIKAAAAKDRRNLSDWIRCRLEDAVAKGREQQTSEAA